MVCLSSIDSYKRVEQWRPRKAVSSITSTNLVSSLLRGSRRDPDNGQGEDERRQQTSLPQSRVYLKDHSEKST